MHKDDTQGFYKENAFTIEELRERSFGKNDFGVRHLSKYLCIVEVCLRDFMTIVEKEY